MIVAYIAGPFRAPTAWGIAENVRNAERVGLQVARAGAMPMIPHANTAHFHGEGDDALWLAGTMELLRRCDCVVLVPGWERSSGTRAEAAEANRLGIPVIDLRALRETYWSEDDADDFDARLLKREFSAIGPGTPQWSRYVGERARAVAASARTIAPDARPGKKFRVRTRRVGSDAVVSFVIREPATPPTEFLAARAVESVTS